MNLENNILIKFTFLFSDCYIFFFYMGARGGHVTFIHEYNIKEIEYDMQTTLVQAWLCLMMSSF